MMAWTQHDRGAVAEMPACVVGAIPARSTQKLEGNGVKNSMRDLLPSDRIAKDFRSIEDEHGSFIPMCWNNPKDWAQWWLRQEELHDFIRLTNEQREVFNQILVSGDIA